MSDVSREEIMEVYHAAQRLMKMSRFEEAAVYLKRCLAGCETVGDVASCETILEELARCYELTSRYDEGIDSLNKIVPLIRDDGPSRRMAILHHNIAYFYEQKGELDRAEYYFRLSSQIAGEAGDHRGRAFSLTMLAQILHGTQRSELAVENLMIAINLLSEAQAEELDTVMDFTRALARNEGIENIDAIARNAISSPETLHRFLDS